MSRSKHVKVRIQKRALDDKYTVLPNDLTRGKGIYAHLSEYARLELAAGLSCREGWETTLEEIESWLPTLGRDRQEAVRRELREHGFLSMVRERIPAGQPDGGRYAWSFMFLMEPLPEEERDSLRTKVEKPVKAGRTMPGSPGISESPGRTMPGSPGHGQPGHGQPGPGGQGSVPSYRERTKEKEQTPSLPRSDSPPNPPPTAEREGDIPKEPPKLDQAVDWLAQRRRDGQWRPVVIREALIEGVTATGGDLAYVFRALQALADPRNDATFGKTTSPRRLTSKLDGPWWPPRNQAAEGPSEAGSPPNPPWCGYCVPATRRQTHEPGERAAKCTSCPPDAVAAERMVA